jgi:hypothetical protein
LELRPVVRPTVAGSDNVYVPQLQRVGGVVWYLRGHLGQRFASTATVAPKTVAFVANIERFVAQQGVDLVSFGKHQRKDDITQQYLQRFDADEGILYVGRAQEKARVVRTERRRCAHTGMSYPWVVDGSAMVNHYYYFYCVDDDFGPFFLKFCSYFRYTPGRFRTRVITEGVTPSLHVDYKRSRIKQIGYERAFHARGGRGAPHPKNT